MGKIFNNFDLDNNWKLHLKQGNLICTDVESLRISCIKENFENITGFHYTIASKELDKFLENEYDLKTLNLNKNKKLLLLYMGGDYVIEAYSKIPMRLSSNSNVDNINYKSWYEFNEDLKHSIEKYPFIVDLGSISRFDDANIELVKDSMDNMDDICILLYQIQANAKEEIQQVMQKIINDNHDEAKIYNLVFDLDEAGLDFLKTQ